MHLPPPKRIDRPHYEVTIPNEMHQFDLLYMPSDTLYRNKYKYILSRIDVASRYKVARPIRTKQAKDVADMIVDIYIDLSQDIPIVVSSKQRRLKC